MKEIGRSLREELEREKTNFRADKLSLKEELARGVSSIRSDPAQTSDKASPTLNSYPEQSVAPQPQPSGRLTSSPSQVSPYFRRDQVRYQQVSQAAPNLSITIQSLPFFNLSLNRVGVPFLPSVVVKNNDQNGVDSLTVTATVRPTESRCSKSIGSLLSGQSCELTNLFLPADLDAFRKIGEPERGALEISVKQGDREAYRHDHAVVIHPYNYCIVNEEYPKPLATFCTPASRSVDLILDKAMIRMEEKFGVRQIAGDQAGAEHAIKIVHSIYYALRDDFEIGYITVSPQTGLEDGGQRIYTAEKVIEHRRGTCLDLALLFCAALERSGVRSLLILGMGGQGGHAWVGCISPGLIPRDVLVLDWQSLYNLERNRTMLMLDAVAFTHHDVELDQAIAGGSDHLHNEDQFESVWAVHIANCHGAGASPMSID